MPKSTAKSRALGALEFLANRKKYSPAAVCAVYGDDAYLKMEVMAALRDAVLGGNNGEFGVTT
ncbi:MAG TPA: hypothetical protein VHE81_13020, partial [Lacipirellulaceae bacterium]|nr:hypothetical protein [Lacipirellulaceae bacterium]